MEWHGHGESRARWRSDEIVATVMQNATLPWLGKQGYWDGVEEVMMVELLVRWIGQWCSDGNEWAQWSTVRGNGEHGVPLRQGRARGRK